jgi:hypothetical protein
MDIMEIILREQKKLIIALFLSILAGITVSLLGTYSIGIIIVIIGLYLLAKINLNENTSLFLLGLLLYVNLLRPFGGFKIASSLVDLFVILIIIKHILQNGVEKNKGIWLFVTTSFIGLSFFQIFNPNIPSIEAGLQGFRKTSFAFLSFYLGIFSFKNTKQVQEFFIKFSFMCLPLLLYGIKQFLFLSEFDKLYLYANNSDMWTGMLFGKPRAASIFAGPFHFGFFSASLTVINIFLMDVAKKRKNKFLFFLFFVISIYACYCSLTRTNLIAFISAIIIYKLIQMKIRNIIILLPIITGSFIFVINLINTNTYTLLASENKFLRMIGTIANLSEDTRFEGRSHGWETILELTKIHPILAYGTGSAGDTLNTLYNFQYHVTSHNVFLKILMETGLPGLIFFSVLFFGALFLILKNTFNKKDILLKKINACCVALIIVFFVNGLVGSTLDTYPVSGIILMIMGIGVSNLKG